jgi:hypothetical protein
VWAAHRRVPDVVPLFVRVPFGLKCHGVGSHPVPVALVGECSIPVT